MALLALAVVGACTGNAEGQAATRAQDACIVALEPVAQRRAPTSDEAQQAARLADSAADVDDRWVPLRARTHDLNTAVLHGVDPQPAVDALADECRRVNEIVRSNQR